MMYVNKMKKRLAASALAALIAPAMVFGGAFLGVASDAQAAPKSGNCQVYEILASKEGEAKIPKDLEFMKDWLTDEPYDRYKSFQLLDKKSFKIKLGEESGVKFKTGHKMKLKLLGGDEKRLKYSLFLTQADGKEELVRMEYSIEDNGLIFVQGGEHTVDGKQWKVLWATHCVRDS